MSSAVRRGSLAVLKAMTPPARAAWSTRAELLHAGAIVLGWTGITWGVARLLVWEVWPISGGLFLLSMAGWGHLRQLFGRGLYYLTRPVKRDG